jgi:ATP-dependent helicase/nuclease subunit A
MNIRIVTASAGTGKTTHLSRLLRDAVGSRQARPEAIVATTFTKQAAAELLNRARSELLRQGQGRAAEALMTARIGTVNSVCGGLVTDFALELGLSPELRVLDENAAELELVRALATVVDAEGSEALDRYKDIFDHGFDWQYEVRRMIESARANGLAADALADCARRSKETLDQCLGPVEQDGTVLDEGLRRSIEVARAAINPALDATKTTGGYVQLLNECHGYLERRSLRWGNWAKLGKEEPGAKSRVHAAGVRAAAAAHLRHPRLRREMHELIDLLFGAAAAGLAAYQRHKEALGLLDYVDQEVLALQLLRRDDIREALAGKMDLVLVDEFQDTSPLQLAIFLALARIAHASVWVGDPKQAIYGFRGTDPRLMDAAIESLTNTRDPDLVAAAVDQVTGQRPVETLSKSYRSRPALITPTNEIFARAFAQQGMPETRTRVVGALTVDPTELGPALSHWPLTGRSQGERAHALAAGVVALLATSPRVRGRQTGAIRPASLADLAILCRTNSQCQDVAEALGLQGLPAVVARVGLLDSAEGQVFVAGLRLWVDPRDRLAAAVLHRAIECPEDPNRFVADVLTDSEPAPLFESPAVAAILGARVRYPDVDVLGAIDHMVQASGLRRLCAEWGTSAQRTANLDALRAHAGTYCDERLASRDTPSVVGFLAHLREMTGGSGWDAARTDRCALVAGQQAISVSTWHAAKGLEWPIVTLYGLETLREPLAYGVHVMNERQTFDLADPLRGRWIRYWPNPYTTSNQQGPVKTAYDQSPAYRDVTERSNREALRVLYVGWTRARDRLILAAERGKLLNGLLGILPRMDATLISEPRAARGGGVEHVAVTWAGHAAEVEVRPCASQPPAPLPLIPGSVRVGRTATDYPRARLSPSSAEPRPCTVSDPITLGSALAAAGSPDVNELGMAVHEFLAADDRALSAAEREELALGLLERHRVASAIAPGALLTIGDRLWGWLDARFPGGRIRREWPVLRRLETGTLVAGAADLVVETADHIAIVDHKSTATHRGALAKAETFAAQLACYADAMAKTGEGKTVSTWVHLPLAGMVVGVTVDSESASE